VTATAAIASQARRHGLAVVFRFNVRNSRAEQWLSDHSSTLVTRILDDQRNAVRAALTAGMEAGVNPRSMALDITGRINRATGRREGGIIGLTAQQEDYSRNALAELMSGNRTAMRNYLTRARRDKRFDRTVLKAMNEGVGLSRSQAEKIVGRYCDGLLNLRGETVARLEAKASLHRAEQESFLQAVDTGAVNPADVKRRWRHLSETSETSTFRWMARRSVSMSRLSRQMAPALCIPAIRAPRSDIPQIADARSQPQSHSLMHLHAKNWQRISRGADILQCCHRGVGT